MTTTDGVGRGGRVVGELADAAGDQDADVRLAAAGRPEAGGAHRLAKRAAISSSVSGTGSASIAADVAQPAHVAVEEERLAVVGAQRLVDAFAVQEPVIEDRDDRVLLIGRCGR